MIGWKTGIGFCNNWLNFTKNWNYQQCSPCAIHFSCRWCTNMEQIFMAEISSTWRKYKMANIRMAFCRKLHVQEDSSDIWIKVWEKIKNQLVNHCVGTCFFYFFIKKLINASRQSPSLFHIGATHTFLSHFIHLFCYVEKEGMKVKIS